MANDHDEIRTAVIEALTMTRVTCDHKALEYMAAHMDDVSVRRCVTRVPNAP